MLIQRKLKALRSFFDGSRNITDLGMFWTRPRAWVGGELANRAGLQPLRCVYQGMSHRPSVKYAPPRLRAQAQRLIDDGMIIIPDFLPQDVFERVCQEHEASFSNDRETIFRKIDDTVNKRSHKYTGSSDAISSVEIRGVRQESCKVTSETSPTALQALVQNKDIWALASTATGKRVKYRPGAFFHRELRAEGAEEDTEQNIILHEDVPYPSIKVFYYINDNTEENGAFVVASRSQRLDLQRLHHEYLYSIDIARQKKGKAVSHPLHVSGRMEVHGQAYAKESLKEVQAIGKANTLIIANTMAFHRRGGSAIGNDRQQLRMCFRHVETLHHRLFPAFTTKHSKRYLETAYY